MATHDFVASLCLDAAGLHFSTFSHRIRIEKTNPKKWILFIGQFLFRSMYELNMVIGIMRSVALKLSPLIKFRERKWKQANTEGWHTYYDD